MNLEQFNFEKTPSFEAQEVATQSIGKNSYVKLFRNTQIVGNQTHVRTKVVKVLHNKEVFNVMCINDEDLKKVLKTIGKRK